MSSSDGVAGRSSCTLTAPSQPHSARNTRSAPSAPPTPSSVKRTRSPRSGPDVRLAPQAASARAARCTSPETTTVTVPLSACARSISSGVPSATSVPRRRISSRVQTAAISESTCEEIRMDMRPEKP